MLAVLLVVVGALAWWLHQEAPSDRIERPAGERRPDFRVEGLTATSMDESGRPDRRLSATELRHYPGDGASELDDPVLTLFKEGAPPWTVRSESGQVNADGDQIDLRGDVRIDRAGSAETRPLHLRTEALRIELEEEIARSDRPVQLTSGQDWLTAAGAKVWFGDDLRVELFGSTRARMAVPADGTTAPSETAEEAQ